MCGVRPLGSAHVGAVPTSAGPNGARGLVKRVGHGPGTVEQPSGKETLPGLCPKFNPGRSEVAPEVL